MTAPLCSPRRALAPFFKTAATALACAGLAVSLSACGKDGGGAKGASQVAMKVNGEEVSTHQVDLLLRRQAPAGVPGQADATVRRVLDGLVDQELAAQAARKEGLDRDPQVVQTMEATKREVLARAYLDRLTEKLTEPTSDEVDRYYDAHPNLFAERRLYSLQEASVSAPNERLPALKARLEATSSPEKLAEALRAESLQPALRLVSISAEDVPLGLLDPIAALREGQSLVITGDGGARILTLLRSQPAPVSRSGATRQITSFLVNERRREAVQQGMKRLREPARVEYLGRYAELAGPAASAPAAASAASR